MRNARSLLLWLLVGIAGLALLVWAYPRAYSFRPDRWTLTRDEAVGMALERLRDLGEPVKDPYIVALLGPDTSLERRLQLAVDRHGEERVRRSALPEQIFTWDVYVFPRGAPQEEWAYIVSVSTSGRIVLLRRRFDAQEKGRTISPQAARQQADAVLAKEGIDLSLYEEPEVRSQQLAGRTDQTVRYRDRRNPLTDGRTHGIQVLFAGDRYAGFGYWLDEPPAQAVGRSLRGVNLLFIIRVVWVILMTTLLAVPFLKRYHEGEIGVRRGVQIFLMVVASGLIVMLLGSRANSQGSGFGFTAREQNTWLVLLFQMVFYIFPAGILAFFAWSVGESVCRERWGHKLAAFDALFRGDLANETVARACYRGWMAGFATAGATMALLLVVRALGGWPLASAILSRTGDWQGLEAVAGGLATTAPFYLAVILWLLPLAVRRFGTWGGALAATLVGAVVFAPMAVILPMGWTVALALVPAAVLVALFLATDLLSAFLAGLVTQTLLSVYPLLTADDSTLHLHGWSGLVLLAIPLVLSLRALGSGREFVYRYEDVPPHVRRIAERERQRVELETARRIQSSILPDLPPRLAGVDIAHAYLPASEVGGDFYDVLALEDGRLAVAVGDVAGHGVSSGLIMSMAKSALAVQVTFDPDVAQVFRTLNRTVYQTARKRLLATLCYALIDPRRLEMLYASAGHLYPYRISAAGRVEFLESTAYPLGVRGELVVEPRTARLAPGDTLFLFSDGLVEARREGSDEQFGFDRLEASLARHANKDVDGLRDGILADVTKFTANAPREDDQTILVLRLP